MIYNIQLKALNFRTIFQKTSRRILQNMLVFQKTRYCFPHLLPSPDGTNYMGNVFILTCHEESETSFITRNVHFYAITYNYNDSSLIDNFNNAITESLFTKFNGTLTDTHSYQFSEYNLPYKLHQQFGIKQN